MFAAGRSLPHARHEGQSSALNHFRWDYAAEPFVCGIRPGGASLNSSALTPTDSPARLFNYTGRRNRSGIFRPGGFPRKLREETGRPRTRRIASDFLDFLDS